MLSTCLVHNVQRYRSLLKEVPSKKKMIPLVFLCAIALVSADEAYDSKRTKQQPHIIFIVADDLGFNDVSFHGSKQIPTPNIDSLAEKGVILNNYYVTHICSPSRGSLMTGMYTIHTGFTHDVIHNPEPWGLPLKFTLFPERLQSVGYATHAVGKWHLGFYKKEYTPLHRGFDSHYGYWGGSEDYFNHTHKDSGLSGLDFRCNMDVIEKEQGVYSAGLFTREAVRILQTHNTSQPLFMYLAFQSVHTGDQDAPLQVPKEYEDRFPNIEDRHRRTFAGMVSALDDSIGVVYEALKDNGYLDNSVVVFTTDNGGPPAGLKGNYASNWPFRGGKHTLWEGGVHGVSYVWSPLISAKPRVSHDLMHITDWYRTLLHVAGYQDESLNQLDGYDLWETIANGKESPRKEVVLNIDPIEHSRAIIVGKYKLIGGTQFTGKWNKWYGPEGERVQPPTPAEIKCGPVPEGALEDCKLHEHTFCVFDLEKDPCEYHNLAEEDPELLKRLKERMEYYKSTAVKNLNKKEDKRSNPKYYGGVWVNWYDYLSDEESAMEGEDKEYDDNLYDGDDDDVLDGLL